MPEDKHRKVGNKELENLCKWLDYETTRLKLEIFFQHRACWDPAECASRTLERIAAKLDDTLELRGEEPVKDKIAYVMKVAWNIFYESRREEKREEIAIEEYTEWQKGSHKSRVELVRDKCREHCCQELFKRCPDEMLLQAQYYAKGRRHSKELRVKLARQHGISLNMLTVKVFRAKEVLWRCFDACVKECEEKHRNPLW